MDYHERIVSDPAICGGQPVLRGTRVLVRVILGYLAHGEPIEIILREFPSLAEEDVRAVIALAAASERAPKIDRGDDLVFAVTSENSAELRVLKRKRLSDLYGSLPATRAFPGKQELRSEVGRELGKSLRERKP